MMLDGASVGEISDSEISENVAASGGATSRAGAFSLWTSSSLTLVRCIVRQNVAHLGGEVSEGGGICVQQSRGNSRASRSSTRICEATLPCRAARCRAAAWSA